MFGLGLRLLAQGHLRGRAAGALARAHAEVFDTVEVNATLLGPVLWQLPENFHRDDAVLAEALEQLPRPARHCFEFRHPSWFAPTVVRLLKDTMPPW